jgi:hypothetical protein
MGCRTACDGRPLRGIVSPNEAAIKKAERLYGVLGWLGLVLIFAGTAAQVVGAWPR